MVNGALLLSSNPFLAVRYARSITEQKFISTGFPALLAFKFQGIANMGGCSGNGVCDHRNKVGFNKGQGVFGLFE